jgi:hypothetical protein
MTASTPEAGVRPAARSPGPPARAASAPADRVLGLDRAFLAGLGLTVLAGVLFWLTARGTNLGRPDLYYLAESFLQGRTWLEPPAPIYDAIDRGDRWFVPFGPFPALLLAPIVAVVGPQAAQFLDSGINASLAGIAVGLAWMLTGRLGVAHLGHRAALVVLFGFSTALWWVTARGSVWHTGQIVATVVTMACLVEVFGRRRAVVVGLLAGAAFLTRVPLAFAVPFYALLLLTDWEGATRWRERLRALFAPTAIRTAILLGLGVAPSIAFFLWYNATRFGSPLETGYGLASLTGFLSERRAMGVMSPVHVPWNLELFLLHVPPPVAQFPWIRPDGFGMSVLLTSPGLLLAFLAPRRLSQTWWLAGAALLVLVPTLFYYGGGFHQFGYRYFLDSVPFVFALAALAVAHRRRLGAPWLVAIAVGVAVNAAGVWWAPVA